MPDEVLSEPLQLDAFRPGVALTFSAVHQPSEEEVDCMLWLIRRLYEPDPPPVPPLQVIGPTLSGALMGLLDQEDGRQLIRLRMPPAEDEAQLWRRPLLILVAVRWDPLRASTMRTNKLAAELMRAFRNAVDAAGAPGRLG